MITNYNRRKIGQVFLFVYKSESLQPLLDALGDIALDGGKYLTIWITIKVV